MSIRTKLLSTAILAVLGSVAAHAQVLGGSAGLGGSLAGGLRNSGAMTHGAASGAFGADVDTGSLRQRTRDTASETTGRVRNTADKTRARAHSRVNNVRGRADSAAVSAATNARGAASAGTDRTAMAAGSIASDASANGTQATTALQGAAVSDIAIPRGDRPALARRAVSDTRHQATGNLTHAADIATPAESNESHSSTDRATVGGAVAGSGAQNLDTAPASLQTQGYASGSSSVSRDGASVQSEAAGQGSAHVRREQAM